MGYFPVRYDSTVVIYKPKMFIRLATGASFKLQNFGGFTSTLVVWKLKLFLMQQLLHVATYLVGFVKEVLILQFRGAWIAEFYHTWLWSSVHCAMPWAVSLSLGDDKLFLDPSTTSTLSSWFYLVYLIWYYYLSLKFVIWIVKQKIEIERN